MTTRTNTIPRCWARDVATARPGQHPWGQVCYGSHGCADWWLARSLADRRAHRLCADPIPHEGPHVYFDARDWRILPPQPMTMWVCPGLQPEELLP